VSTSETGIFDLVPGERLKAFQFDRPGEQPGGMAAGGMAE
jgi:hypothetical protein